MHSAKQGPSVLLHGKRGSLPGDGFTPAKQAGHSSSPSPREHTGSCSRGAPGDQGGSWARWRGGGIGWWGLEGFASFAFRLIHVGEIWGRFRGAQGWRVGSGWRFAVLVLPRGETQLISGVRKDLWVPFSSLKYRHGPWH